MNEISPPSSLTDQVVEVVRRAILSGELVPNELYSVNQLAERFEVSRTPVREGLLRLAEAGMVSFERNRGFRVLGSRASDVARVFQMRILLEVPATFFAAQEGKSVPFDELEDQLNGMSRAAEQDDRSTFWKFDTEFHSLLIGTPGNPELVKVVSDLRYKVSTKGISTVDGHRTLADVANEHRPIMEFVLKRDPAGAANAMREHLIATARILLATRPEEADAPRDPFDLILEADSWARAALDYL